MNPTREQYLGNLKEIGNSVTAYLVTIDCENKTLVEISDESLEYLEEDFDDIFFSENNNSKEIIKNTTKLLGTIISLGGSYELALQNKHYADLYESLYKPRLENLTSITNETNDTLDSTGKKLQDFSRVLLLAQKTLKSNSRDLSVQEIIPTQNTLKRFRKFSTGYNSSLNAGFGGLVGGTTALGAWGVVSIIGSASTGTAISTLSGVAATNATLAWFGGGSLAAGGAGMAGGFWMLSGIMSAPIIYFSTKNSYKKVDKIKQEKLELINEIKRITLIEPEAKKQMIELKTHSKFISDLINKSTPKILAQVSAFKKNSSFFYRIFGGHLNEKQLDAYDTLNKVSSEALLKLGVK